MVEPSVSSPLPVYAQLTASQTKSGKYPYLYSQSQAVRLLISLVPSSRLDPRPISPPMPRYPSNQSIILLYHPINPTSPNEWSSNLASSRTNPRTGPRD
jgi:hypothetical protein